MKQGRADIIVGLDYGDEGKGRFTDIKLQSGDYAVAARFNGGNNAGHTLIAEDGKKIILNAIPSGVFYPDVINYIGSGCVVNPVHILEEELPKVEEQVKLDGRLKISALATAITPIHIFWDKITGAMIGTTGKGIGPAYADKARRAEGDSIKNLRLGDILANPAKARKSLIENYEMTLDCMKQTFTLDHLAKVCRAFGHKGEIPMSRAVLGLILDAKAELREKIDKFIEAVIELDRQGYIEKDALWVTKMVEEGKNVLMEGAQAYGIDVTYGTVPYQTSSSTVAGNAFVGGDLSSKYHGEIFGVSKLIASRVGAGPFVGEFGDRQSEVYCDAKDKNGKPLHDAEEEALIYNAEEMLQSRDPMKFGIGMRMKTGEYGATTKRPRRLGLVDTHRMAAAARRTGVDKLYLTKADCLTNYADKPLFDGKIPLITGYELDGRSIDHVPFTADELYRVQYRLKMINVFEDISEVREERHLPEQAKQLVDELQNATRCKIAGLGVGPGRDELVKLK